MEEVWSLIFRTTLIYIVLIIIMRLMGKREVGKLSVFDLIVYFMIADIAAMALQLDQKIIHVLIPICTLSILQIILSLILLRSRKARGILDGEPTTIIKNGKIQDQEMAKIRYNLDDLLMQLRDRSISDPSQVEFAFLETSGRLSIFPKEKYRSLEVGDITGESGENQDFVMPVPVVIEGNIKDVGLSKLNKSRAWLHQEMELQGYHDVKDIYYASVCDDKLFIDPLDRN